MKNLDLSTWSVLFSNHTKTLIYYLMELFSHGIIILIHIFKAKSVLETVAKILSTYNLFVKSLHT